MTNPIGFFTLGSSPFVENESFLHSDEHFPPENLLIFSGGLPVTGGSGPIRSQSGRVFLIPDAEKVPLLFSQFRSPCFNLKKENQYNKIHHNCRQRKAKRNSHGNSHGSTLFISTSPIATAEKLQSTAFLER